VATQAATSSAIVSLSGMRLRGEDAEFGFGQIEPGAVFGHVMPFEALDQAPGLGGREGLVKRSGGVGVEIVLDEDDCRGVAK